MVTAPDKIPIFGNVCGEVCMCGCDEHEGNVRRGLEVSAQCWDLFILLEKTRIVGRRKVSYSQTKLFKLISVNCFLFQLL
jgi:hypothetical protein